MAATNITIPTLTYRVATPSDAPLLQDMIERGFRAEDTARPEWTCDMKIGNAFRLPLANVERAIANPEGCIIVASDASTDAVAACFEVARKADDLARFAWFVIAQEYQMKGLGRVVLAYAEQFVAERWEGVRRLDMNAVSSREKLIKWYERCGYVKTGETQPFPMEEDLHFIMLEKKLDGGV